MLDVLLAIAMRGDTKIERTVTRERCEYTCVRTYSYERRGLRVSSALRLRLRRKPR